MEMIRWIGLVASVACLAVYVAILADALRRGASFPGVIHGRLVLGAWPGRVTWAVLLLSALGAQGTRLISRSMLNGREFKVPIRAEGYYPAIQDLPHVDHARTSAGGTHLPFYDEQHARVFYTDGRAALEVESRTLVFPFWFIVGAVLYAWSVGGKREVGFLAERGCTAGDPLERTHSV